MKKSRFTEEQIIAILLEQEHTMRRKTLYGQCCRESRARLPLPLLT